jgi:hypothetical protein
MRPIGGAMSTEGAVKDGWMPSDGPSSADRMEARA